MKKCNVQDLLENIQGWEYRQNKIDQELITFEARCWVNYILF